MKETVEELKIFICTRASLAAELMRKGYEGRETINPFKPDLLAWTFEIDKDLAHIVSSYYAERGSQPPAVIREYVSEEKNNG